MTEKKTSELVLEDGCFDEATCLMCGLIMLAFGIFGAEASFTWVGGFGTLFGGLGVAKFWLTVYACRQVEKMGEVVK